MSFYKFSGLIFSNRTLFASLLFFSPLCWNTASAQLLFLDTFEYSATRGASNTPSIFQQQGGWDGAKHNSTGYLYTTPSIPGYAGQLPGINSTNVLVIESLAGSSHSQTDFYLQYGNPENAGYDDHVPGNVWFQFWIYPARSGNQQTGFHSREKFIYPCASAYPCNSGKWLWMLGNASYEPYNSTITNGNAYIFSRDNQVGTVSYSLADEWNASKIGQTNINEYIAANRWTLVKIHYDTSGANGSYEAWLRPLGGNWTKVAEWIGGVTPNFTWTIPAAHQGGHRAIRMPTTLPAANSAGTEDAWIYMDDFAISTTESSLPVYSDVGSVSPPDAPSAVGAQQTQ